VKTKPDSMIEKFKAFVRQPYAWPGGYPLFALFNTGDYCCKNCAKSKYKTIMSELRADDDTGWEIIGVDVNWEDENLYCGVCNEKIESAYGEVDDNGEQ